MKNVLLNRVILISFFLLLINIGCNKEEDDPKPQPESGMETIISEETYVIDSNLLSKPQIEGNIYTFNYTSGQPDIQAGDILVGQTDSGYLRRVISVAFQDNQMIAETNQGYLSDVIEQCDIHDSITIKIGEKTTWRGQVIPVHVTQMQKGVDITNGKINLTDVLLFSGDYQGSHLEAKITEGYIEFEPTYTLEIVKPLFSPLQLMKITAGGHLALHCQIEVECDGAVVYEPDIPSLFTIWVGPVPFIPLVPTFIKLSFQPGLDVAINVGGHVSQGYEASSYVEYGAIYTIDKGWEKINKKGFDLYALPLDWSINGNIYAKGWVSPRVDLKMAGIFGPYMYAGPYLKFTGVLNYPQWQYEFAGGIDGYAGFEMNIFGWSLVNYYAEIFNWQKTLVSDQGSLAGNQPPFASFTVSPISGDLSTIFSFDASNSSDTEDPASALQVRWDFDGNGNWDTGWENGKIAQHQYTQENTYTARLEVKDTEGLTSTTTEIVHVTSVGNEPPVAEFTASPTNGSPPLTVYFTDLSSNNPSTWQWEFGDGETSSQQNPTHTYDDVGNYTVKLTVSNSCGSDFLQKSGYIMVFSDGGVGEPCPGIPTVTYEGQVYNTVFIGSQCWFKENLNVGTMINGSQNMNNNITIEKYCYNNDPLNCYTYGGLYQWDEVMQYTTFEGSQGICPSGWHVPTDEEWMQLEGEVDSQFGFPDTEWDNGGWRGYDVGLRLKSTNSWNNNGNGIDLYNFTALPGGRRNINGDLDYLGDIGHWWSSSGNENSAWYRKLDFEHNKSRRNNDNVEYGLSVRCLKDN